MFERLNELCKQKGTSITALCVSVTGNKGNLSTWKKGYMRSDWLAKCAKKLGVSADYILTGEVSRDKLSDDELDLLDAFAKLDRKQKRKLIVAVESMADKSSADSVTVNLATISDAPERERETVGDSD